MKKKWKKTGTKNGRRREDYVQEKKREGEAEEEMKEKRKNM